MLILIGTLMMGCATSRSPVITSRQLSADKYEIMAKADYTRVSLIFHDRAMEVCRNKGIYKIKNINTKIELRRPMSMVGTIECPKDGFWRKGNMSRTEVDKDFYECLRDVEILIGLRGKSDSKEFELYFQWLYDIQKKNGLFEKCMRAKGYDFIEIDKEKMKELDEMLKKFKNDKAPDKIK